MNRARDGHMAALALAAFTAAVLTALTARSVPRLRAGLLTPSTPEPDPRVDSAPTDASAVEELHDAPDAGPARGPVVRADDVLRRDAAASSGVRTRRPAPKNPSASTSASARFTSTEATPANQSRPASSSGTPVFSAKHPAGRAFAREASKPERPEGAWAARRSGASAPRAGHDVRKGAVSSHSRPPALGRALPAAGTRRSAGAARASPSGETALFAAARLRGRGRRERPGETAANRKKKVSRFRPLTLSGLLGRRALRPPPPSLQPPKEMETLTTAHAPIPSRPAGLAQVEEIDPARLGRDRRSDAHWDGRRWHSGAVHGVAQNGTWAWLYNDSGRWWASADGKSLLRRDGLWWMKEGGVWFVVHDGEPWALRPFHDWDAEGLFHPATGTEMVYSRDLTKVAVVTPGHGAVVFDAATGGELASIPEAAMPARRRPRAPERLSRPGP